MMEKSNEENDLPGFEQIIEGYTDAELRNVLKKRKLYQKDAADFAIHEAIKRGMIYSEQDLFAREFNHEPEKSSIFPSIENEKARAKFKKSITRSLLVMGVIPLVWGGLRIFEGLIPEGILIFVFGAAWSLTSFQLMRSVNMKLVYFMFFLLALLIAYLVKTMIAANSLTTIDILITTVTVGLVFYGIGFLSKIKD